MVQFNFLYWVYVANFGLIVYNYSCNLTLHKFLYRRRDFDIMHKVGLGLHKLEALDNILQEIDQNDQDLPIALGFITA